MNTSNPHWASFLGGNWITDFVNTIYKSISQFQLKLICRFEVEDENSHKTCSIIKDVLRNFAKFTGKGLKHSTLSKKSFWNRCFPVNFAKFIRTLFLQNTSGRLLLEDEEPPEYFFFFLTSINYIPSFNMFFHISKMNRCYIICIIVHIYWSLPYLFLLI